MRPEGSVVLKWVYVFFVLVHFTKKQQCPGKNNELNYQCLHCKVNSHISTLCKDIDKHKNAPSQTNSNVCLNASEIVSAEHFIIMPIMEDRFKSLQS